MDAKTKTTLEKLGKVGIKILVLLVIIALLAFMFKQYNSNRTEEIENDALMQGNVKMTEIDLNSMLEGTVDTVYVSEGDQVKAGDIILKIDADIVETQVSQAQAGVAQANAAVAQARATQAAAEAVLSKAKNGARQEDIEKAKAAFDYAESSFNRMQTLYEQGAISANDFEGVQAQYLAAKATYEEALNGAQSEDIEAAAAQVEQAKAAVQQYQATVEQANATVDQANAYLDKSVLTAPSDGVVTALNVEKGELVSTGMALATMRTVDDAWIEVNVNETLLGLVSEGHQVKLSFPAYEDEDFTGTVASVAKNPDFATKKATNENGSFDVLSYCVKINLDDVNEQLYSGMTAIVDFSNESDSGDSSNSSTVDDSSADSSTAADKTTSGEGDDQ